LGNVFWSLVFAFVCAYSFCSPVVGLDVASDVLNSVGATGVPLASNPAGQQDKKQRELYVGNLATGMVTSPMLKVSVLRECAGEWSPARCPYSACAQNSARASDDGPIADTADSTTPLIQH
jgi:hypothetical protein